MAGVRAFQRSPESIPKNPLFDMTEERTFYDMYFDIICTDDFSQFFLPSGKVRPE